MAKEETLERAGLTIKGEATKLRDEVTTTTPATADEHSEPNAGDAKPHDPPVRTNRPDVDVAQTLGAGAGAHQFVSDPAIDRDGRFVGDQPAKLEEAQRAGAEEARSDTDTSTRPASSQKTGSK